jgi:putrescine transport system permease protein
MAELAAVGRRHGLALRRTMARATQQRGGSFIVVLAPFLWLTVLFLIPCLIILKISLSQTAIAQPPYTPVLDLAAGWAAFKDFLAALSIENYALLTRDTIYLSSYLKSLQVAAISTGILLLIGYPFAYAIARTSGRWQAAFVLMVILPFWTSFLIRVYAWITILQHDGLLNRALIELGLIGAPIAWLASDTAVYIGIVYSYLPFMVLPLYATLQQIDDSLLEAAADLGCRRWQAFVKVTLPLSLPGVLAGSLLCFIPVVGEFVIPDLLGSSSSLMIGQTLWTEFFSNKDWPIASAIAIVLLCVLVAPIAAFEYMRARELKGH